MLGLLFDRNYLPLQEVLEASRDDRIPRMKKMIDLMSKDGIQITYDEVLAHKPEEATLGRPHLADALVSKNIVKNRDQAF
jgi:ribosomal protein L21